MKLLLLIILCVFTTNAFSQTSEAITEEKSSAWIKVIEDPVVVSKPASVKKQTATRKKRTTKTEPARPKQNAQEEFEKTNQQINRFKKQKGE
jgi:hypothetical protein